MEKEKNIYKVLFLNCVLKNVRNNQRVAEIVIVKIHLSLLKNVSLVRIFKDSLKDITSMTKMVPLEEHGTSETPERTGFLTVSLSCPGDKPIIQ